ncbi:MAG: hypothetical protein EOO04_27400 [Chitinophagaceae bacterium]|nr:MAG: hypothetical protein EOO04_27400 [Chitinophagaceae bacterium]
MTEGPDYYFTDEGLMVMTKAYHLERGFCCGNGCRHCPFEYINVPEPKRSVMIQKSQENNDTKEK